MRNLKAHPISIVEIEKCLNDLAGQLADLEPKRIGDMRPTLLRAAAKMISRVDFAVHEIKTTK